MKILEIKNLPVNDLKVIRFARFPDDRGYFSSLYRLSDLSGLDFLSGFEIAEAGDSFSRAGVVRGLHFQWNPGQGKLVRTLSGHMVDMVLDLRRSSSTFGRLALYSMPADSGRDWDEWIWIPPGLAHGNFFLQQSHITYLMSGGYNPACEASISPWAPDLDWSEADPEPAAEFSRLTAQGPTVSEKDRRGLSLAAWLASGPARECGF